MEATNHNSAIHGDHSVGWNLENSYAQLPSLFFARAEPTPVRDPHVVLLNLKLGESLGLKLQSLSEEAAARLFSGNTLPPGSIPIAQAYAGHQFGGFTMLGDGRAILMGEQRTPNGELFDLQYKGTGPTKYSRRGDGRAALGPMLREYIISEAMFALNIPTTRSLAVVSTGERVFRESPLPGAVLTRVASSHIRVGTFQYLAALQDVPGLRILADYCIGRHDKDLAKDDDRYVEFLRRVMHRQASLVARWLQVGFIHGVMNTDNVAVSGETIDYGPCAFMDRYHPQMVFSSIDHGGRYAYGNQPTICHWNLVRFAETLLPLLHPEEQEAIRIATQILETFPDVFEKEWLAAMGSKIGLAEAEPRDKKLIEDLLAWMADEQLDFTNTFRDVMSESALLQPPYLQEFFLKWKRDWEYRLEETKTSRDQAILVMSRANPVVIPRNHRVEEVLEAASSRNDLEPAHQLLTVLSQPFRDCPENVCYRQPPSPDQQVYQTFCGT